MSNRAHFLQVQKSTGRTPPELVGPKFPWRVRHLWDYFNLLNRGRTHSANGPHPLTWEGIKAWSEMTDTHLQEWELYAIKALDAEWLRSVQEDTGHG